jgi:hypothetical protein
VDKYPSIKSLLAAGYLIDASDWLDVWFMALFVLA